MYNRYPKIAKMLEEISADSGGSALDELEGALAEATPEQLVTIAIGEESDQKATALEIGLTEAEYQTLSMFLNIAFDGYQEPERENDG